MRITIDLYNDNPDDLGTVVGLINTELIRKRVKDAEEPTDGGQRGAKPWVLTAMQQLEAKHGEQIPLWALLELNNKAGLSEKDLSAAISQLKVDGEVYETQEGFIKKTETNRIT